MTQKKERKKNQNAYSLLNLHRYGLGTIILFLRYFARWKAVGFKGFQGDDYFAIVSLFFWTVSYDLIYLDYRGVC